MDKIYKVVIKGHQYIYYGNRYEVLANGFIAIYDNSNIVVIVRRFDIFSEHDN